MLQQSKEIIIYKFIKSEFLTIFDNLDRKQYFKNAYLKKIFILDRKFI